MTHAKFGNLITSLNYDKDQLFETAGSFNTSKNMQQRSMEMLHDEKVNSTFKHYCPLNYNRQRTGPVLANKPSGFSSGALRTSHGTRQRLSNM